MPSNHLILCCPLLPPSVFPSKSVLRIRWPKYWSFSFSISFSSEYLGLISFRIDWFDLLAVSNTTVQRHPFLQHPAFSIVQLSHPYMTTRKTIALTRCMFVSKVMSLLFNMLSRFVISFLPRSKCLFSFMATVTICSDFGARENSLSPFPLFLHLFAMKWWN